MPIPESAYSYHFAFGAPDRVFDYDANGNVIYEGMAKAGTATSAANWIITKLTYDVSNNVTKTQTVFSGIWDNRTTYFS